MLITVSFDIEWQSITGRWQTPSAQYAIMIDDDGGRAESAVSVVKRHKKEKKKKTITNCLKIIL